ncbi:GtrA family protein [Akkermansia sp. N21116]|uniref:GtrA family protein n=1 Tax=Akkermansia sp. N21116 TaxID=3040764 RepID=UPI0031F2D662
MNVNVAYELSFVMNYYLSNYFTFKTKPDVKKGIGVIGSHLVNYGLHIVLLNVFLWIGVSQSLAPLFMYVRSTLF